jgi:DNA-binding XRE family transcriptional regulator
MRIEIVILWQYNIDTIKKGKQHLQSCRKKEVFMADDYIHKILKTLRLNNNLTQEELAKKLNIHRTTYTKWETGVSEPNIFYIRKLVEFYKIDYNTFFYIL